MPPQTHSSRRRPERGTAAAIGLGKHLRGRGSAAYPAVLPRAAANTFREHAMHIRDWPATERPREKLLARGAPVLSDAELLAIFLGSGLRGQDAVATARQLLAAHGPLRRLLDRTPAQLARLP